MCDEEILHFLRFFVCVILCYTKWGTVFLHDRSQAFSPACFSARAFIRSICWVRCLSQRASASASGTCTQRAKLQCRPSRRASLYRWKTPLPASLAVPAQWGHWASVYQLLLPFFSQISSGARSAPQAGHWAVLMMGSIRQVYGST